MSRFWSPALNDLDPYVPGEQPKQGRFIKLNTNENPYPPSPAVAQLLEQVDVDMLRLYPDPDATELKHALAERHYVKQEQVFVGNGSDEVLALAFMAFFRQEKPILYPSVTYSFYPVYCNLFDIAYETLDLDEDFMVNVADYQRPNGGVILANPNAPTGVALALTDVELLVKNNPDSVVVIDEAYVDFGAESAVSLIDKYENLLVIQTFSKSRSLAGLRIGFAMGNAQLIEGLERVKNSFNSYPLDTLAIKCGVVSLGDDEYFTSCCQRIMDSRQWLADELLALNFEVLPSSTNFLFAAPQTKAAELVYQQLREHGVLVRYFNKPVLHQYLRITIGSQQECESLVSALKAILS